MQRTLGIASLFTIRSLSAACRAGAMLLPTAAVLSVVVPASADIKAVEPYFVVVTADNVHMKCSDGNFYYPVRMLKTGDTLRVDGEGGAWLRVEYLPGTMAHVKADEANFDAATKSLKLTRPTKLMAVDAREKPPWWGLLDTDLPTGTTFNNAQPVKGTDGAVEGYLVPAPDAARGYVRAEATRRATEAEARNYRSPNPEMNGAQASAPKEAGPTTPAPMPTPAPTLAPTDTAAAAPTTTPPPVSTPATTPTPTPAPTSTPLPATTTPSPTSSAPATSATPTNAPTPTPITAQPARPAPTPAPEAPKVTSPIEDLQTLRTLFNNVMQGADNEAEIATVISEFNRTINKLGSSDRDSQLRSALNDRLDALKIRQEIIDLRRTAAQNDSIIVEKTRQIRMAIDEAQKQAIYQIVGRMLPSTVYDGRRGLPLMYRIESPDSSVTRTLGYVVPRDGIELLTKTGKVVGIVGDSKFDPALGVNIVAPRRVDVLEIVGGRLQVITDTSTTTTTTNIGGQSTTTSTKQTTTTTSGSGPGTPSGNPGNTTDDQNK
jgi:hypothetical protein